MKGRYKMAVVFDKHEEEMKPLHDFLKENKLTEDEALDMFTFIA